MPTRRTFLISGTAAVAIFGTGMAARTITRDIEPVREPWRTAEQGFEDVRLHSLAHAILAPSPHNRQPWLVELVGNDRLTLFADLDRLLPETDPFNRQIVIGLGAFLELLQQAAAERGYRADMDVWPEGEPQPLLDQRPVAHVRLVADENVLRDPLFGHVLDRRTVRSEFEDRPVEASRMNSLIAAALGEQHANPFAWTDEADTVAELARMANEGWIVETGTKRTHHESTLLTRIGADEVIANPDGIALHGPLMEAYHLSGVLTHGNYDEEGTMAFRSSRSFYKGLIESAPAFGWLTSADDSRVAQIEAGRAWVRLQLAATGAGLAMHPLSQVLQEFGEMRPLYDAFHELVRVEAPARVQGLFRFGHADYPAPAPRWPMRTRLIEA